MASSSVARKRNYTFQRNYKFESHDKDGNFNGLTEDAWRQKILQEWTCDNLKANHITLIFHDKCVEENGMKKDLHVHACAHFKDAITQTEAIKRSGCSSEKNCKAINNKSQAYRYLLHITEKAIAAGKHIYGEDELIIDVAKNKKFDFHKAIQASEDEEDEKEQAKKLKQVIADIQQGAYGDGSFILGQQSIFDKLLLDDDINKLISAKPTNRRLIENAIETKRETWVAQQRASKN